MNAHHRDPEATRAAILDAAEEVFLAKGYGAAAMSEIADHAGVTKSLLHHHFGSKDGLWKEVKLRRFSKYSEVQLGMLRDSEGSVDLLENSFRFYFGFLQRNPELVRIMGWIFLEHDQDECLQLDRELIIEGTAKIREAQERGDLRSDVHPRFILFVMIALCHDWFQHRDHVCETIDFEGPKELLDERFLQDALKIFFEGILPR